MPIVQKMFEPGNLLYFEPFIFPDGGEPKNKFFVVLGDVDELSTYRLGFEGKVTKN